MSSEDSLEQDEPLSNMHTNDLLNSSSILREETVLTSSSSSVSPSLVLRTQDLPPFIQDIIDDQAVSDPAFYTLVVLYTLMILGSVLGNLLVITAVLKSPNMRKANNILIVNLAVSDLLLCSLVSPMTLAEILFKRWPGPQLQLVCQLSGMIPVCITFVSTLTITGIAIDRYKVIVYSSTARTPPKVSTVLLSLLTIWTLSLLLSLPLIFAMSLQVLPMPRAVIPIVKANSVAYCAEEWGKYKKGRLVYSVFSLLVQFILPITLISFAHHSIKKKLQKLPSWQRQPTTATPAIAPVEQSAAAGGGAGGSVTSHKANRIRFSRVDSVKAKRGSLLAPPTNGSSSISPMSSRRVSVTLRRFSQQMTSSVRGHRGDDAADEMDEIARIQNTRLQEKIKRQARTHSLLVSIVVVFALSWFPLNVLNILLDIHQVFESSEVSRICFALCHLIGMSSAFSNPILYGWFNDSFKEEFRNIGRSLFPCLGSSSKCCLRHHRRGNSSRNRRPHSLNCSPTATLLPENKSIAAAANLEKKCKNSNKRKQLLRRKDDVKEEVEEEAMEAMRLKVRHNSDRSQQNVTEEIKHDDDQQQQQQQQQETAIV